MTIRPVFFYTERGSFGGASKMLLRLLNSLPENEFDPVLLTQKHGRLAMEAAEAGINVQTVPFRGVLDTYNHGLLELPVWKKGASVLRILQFNIEARSILEKGDIIWCMNIRSVLTLLPYIMKSGTPTIWNIGLGAPSDGVMKYFNEIALRSCDHIFIESREQIQRMFTKRQRRNFEAKFVVFHKGIDTDRFNPESTDGKLLEGDALKIGTAASLVPRKGHDVFIKAATNCINRTETDVQFYIAGDTPSTSKESYSTELLTLIKEEEMEDNISLLGWVECMPQYLKSLDVFVLTSNNEGIPGAVREAMAMGTPVVATDVGATSDAVIDGETGYLVPPNSPEKTADRIIELIEDTNEANQLATAGRQHVQDEFSIESYVERYESFLRKVYQGSSDSVDTGTK